MHTISIGAPQKSGFSMDPRWVDFSGIHLESERPSPCRAPCQEKRQRLLCMEAFLRSAPQLRCVVHQKATTILSYGAKKSGHKMKVMGM